MKFPSQVSPAAVQTRWMQWIVLLEISKKISKTQNKCREMKKFFFLQFYFQDLRPSSRQLWNEKWKNFMFQQMKIGRGGQSLFELILKHRNNWNLSPHKFFSCTQMATFHFPSSLQTSCRESWWFQQKFSNQTRNSKKKFPHPPKGL